MTAYDAYGNVATGYTGTVHFTSSDPKAVLPATPPSPRRMQDQDLLATLETTGTQSITATDTVTGTSRRHQATSR